MEVTFKWPICGTVQREGELLLPKQVGSCQLRLFTNVQRGKGAGNMYRWASSLHGPTWQSKRRLISLRMRMLATDDGLISAPVPSSLAWPVRLLDKPLCQKQKRKHTGRENKDLDKPLQALEGLRTGTRWSWHTTERCPRQCQHTIAINTKNYWK